MNRVDAYSLLSAELAAYRQVGHAQLVTLVGDNASFVRRADDGMEYTIDISIRWTAQVDGDIIVDATVTPSEWGSPHDRLEDAIVVAKTA